jgi:hypothetical protein
MIPDRKHEQFQKSHTRNPYRGIYRTEHLSDNNTVSPFGANVQSALAYARAERLAVAVHLITNTVPDNYSVKEAIRKSVRTLLEETLLLKDGFRTAGPDRVSDVISLVRLILSFIDTLHASGYLSENNLRITKSAFIKFAEQIRLAEDARFSESLELDAEYFAEPVVPSDATFHTSNRLQHSKHITTDMTADTVTTSDNEQGLEAEEESTPAEIVSGSHTTVDAMRTAEVSSISMGRSTTVTPITAVHPTKRARAEKSAHPQMREPKSAPISTLPSQKSDSRRARILSVIRTIGHANIKDISAVVTDCSEKTIQREVIAMIDEGILGKEGERRWSMYHII